MQKTLLSSILIAGMAAASAAALADSEVPEISLDGLELVDKDRRGEIYSDPGVDWSSYSRIQLDPATVAFKKNWMRDQNRGRPLKVRAEDMERIKAELSELFDQVFSKELTEKGGYDITTESADNVMRITPRIVDLDVYAPDTRSPGITYTFTEQAGLMTLKLEIYDAVTGDLIAAASDRQESPRRGYYQWTTSVSNRVDARHMLERWARDLRERLKKASAPS